MSISPRPYDLQEDPLELKNRISDVAYAEILAQMKTLLNEQLKQTGDSGLEFR